MSQDVAPRQSTKIEPADDRFAALLTIPWCHRYQPVEPRHLADPILLAEAKKALGDGAPPVSKRQAERLANRLLGAFPTPEDKIPKAYREALAAEFEAMPADVASVVAHRLKRECRFLPAVADVAERADPLLARRKRLQDRVAELEQVAARHQAQLASSPNIVSMIDREAALEAVKTALAGAAKAAP